MDYRYEDLRSWTWDKLAEMRGVAAVEAALRALRKAQAQRRLAVEKMMPLGFLLLSIGLWISR